MYVFMAVLQIITAYFGEHLQLQIRGGLMRNIQELYFQSGVPYRILNSYGKQSTSFRQHSLIRSTDGPNDEQNDSDDDRENDNESTDTHHVGIDYSLLSTDYVSSSTPSLSTSSSSPSIPKLITELASRIQSHLRNEEAYPMYDGTIDNDEISTNDYKLTRLFQQKQSLLSTYDSTSKVSTIDQRLTADISIVSNQITTLLFGNYLYLSPLFGTVTYVLVTFITITNSLFINFGALAVGLGLGFAFLGGLLVTVWSYLVSRTYYRSENSFGTLRYFHSRIIQYKEEIAFLKGYTAEELSSLTLLHTYYLRTMQYYLYQGLQNTWSSFQSQYPYFLAYIVIYVSIATNLETNPTGDDDDSQSMIISTGVSVIGQFIAGLISLTDIWNTVITLGGYLARVSDVFHALEDLQTKTTTERTENSYAGEPSTSSTVRIDILVPPDNISNIVTSSTNLSPALAISSTLVDRITKISIPLINGRHIILQGPSGIGKTSLLRNLAGLVSPSSSYTSFIASPLQLLHTVHHQTCVCLPSKPYIPSGSLLVLFQFASVYLRNSTVSSMNTYWTKQNRSFANTLHILHTLLATNQVHPSSEKKVIDICTQIEKERFSNSYLARYWRMGRDPCNLYEMFTLSSTTRTHNASNDTGVPTDIVLYKEALTKMRLEHLCVYLDQEISASIADNDSTNSSSFSHRTNYDWMSFLSLGELQRLLLALAYIQNPKFIILDEATSALDTESERQCLLSLYERGITCIRITHRPIPYSNEEIIRISNRIDYDTNYNVRTSLVNNNDNGLSSVQETFGSLSKETVALQSIPSSSNRDPVSPSSSSPVFTESVVNGKPSVFIEIYEIWKLFKLVVYVPLFRSQSVWSFSNPSVKDTPDSELFRSLLSPRWKNMYNVPFVPTLLRYQSWFLRYLRYIFDYQHNVGTLILLIVSLVSCGSLSYITVQVAYAPGIMFQALLDSDLPRAGTYALFGTVVYFGSAVIGASSRMIGQMLSLVWYARLVQYMTTVYFAGTGKTESRTGNDIEFENDRKRQTDAQSSSVAVHSELHTDIPFFYRIHTPSLLPLVSRSLVPSLDRLDQRMLTDTQNLTVSLGTILFGGNNRLSLIQVLVTLFVTTATIQQTYGSLPLVFGYGYATCGLVLTQFYSRRIPLITNLVTNIEGILRTQFSRVRTYSEQIGFLQFESGEVYRIQRLLASLFALLVHRIHIEFIPRLINNVVAYGGTVIAYMIPTIIIYTYNDGTLGGNIPANVTHVTSLTYLLVSLNLYICSLPDYYTNFTEAIGYVQRVGKLLQVFVDNDEKWGMNSTTYSKPNNSNGQEVTIDNDEKLVNDNSKPSSLCIDAVAGIDYRSIDRNKYHNNEREPTLVNSFTDYDTPMGNYEYNYIGLCTSSLPPLHQPVSFHLEAGQCVLLTGPSGIGKTSLLRVLAGLYINTYSNDNQYNTRNNNGTSRTNSLILKRKPYLRYIENITTTSIDSDTLSSLVSSTAGPYPRIMFIPQRPYILSGTLIDNIVYPLPSWNHQKTIAMQYATLKYSSSVSSSLLSLSSMEQQLYRLIRLFVVTGLYDSLIASSYITNNSSPSSLSSVSKGYINEIIHSLSLYEWYNLFTTAYPWPRILSNGEQYRINICRILYHKPQYVFMDEGFSGLPLADSRKLLQLLCNENIGVILVTH